MSLLFRELIRSLGGEPEKGLTCGERPREPELPRGAAGSGGAGTVPSWRGKGRWESATCGWKSGSSGGMFPGKDELLPWRASQKHPSALMCTSWSSLPKFTPILGPELPAPSQPPSSPGTELTCSRAPDICGAPCHHHHPKQSSLGSARHEGKPSQ